MSKKPWCQGPKELLNHATEHLQKGEDFDLRIAFISVDNAIEIMIKTYIELPERITGLKFSRKEREEAFENFPNLLDALEKSTEGILSREEFGDIEYFHRIRNKLYHEGSGLTVDKDKPTTYLAIAELLYKKLFYPEEKITKGEDSKNLIGEFIFMWNQLESIIFDIIKLELEIENPELSHVKILVEKGFLNKDILGDIDLLRQNRNKLVHGLVESNPAEIKKQIELVANLLNKLTVYLSGKSKN